MGERETKWTELETLMTFELGQGGESNTEKESNYWTKKEKVSTTPPTSIHKTSFSPPFPY